MEQLLAVLVCEQRAAGFGYVAVEVPLEVVDFVLAENGLHLSVNVLTYILTRHIYNALVSSERTVSARNVYAPVGMSAVQVGIGRYHLRLVPDTELQSESVHTVYEHAETALELVLIYIPVAEGTSVVVAHAEPSVIHYEHFDAQLLRTLCEGYKLVGVEIEECRFPAVYEQRTFFGFPLAADKIVSVQTVECACHAAETLV